MCDKFNHMYISRERREHRIFQELLKTVVGLEERLMQGEDNEVGVIAELASTMASYVFKFSSISHITSSPKAHLGQGVMIPKVSKAVCSTGLLQKDRILFLLLPATWKSTAVFITSGQVLYFVLLALIGLTQSASQQYLTYLFSWRKSLTECRTKTKLQSGETIVTGDQWPFFLYADYHYDPEDPWNGLFRSALLVCVGYKLRIDSKFLAQLESQAYKHVFTSPSSVDREPKATRSGNARIHGMTQVTLPSIAYIATQVCLHLESVHLYWESIPPRSDSPSLLRLYSHVRTRSLTLKGSTTPF